MKYNDKMSYDGMSNKDYQPSNAEFAGKEFGTANNYMPRKEREQKKAASQIKKQAYKGRYD